MSSGVTPPPFGPAPGDLTTLAVAYAYLGLKSGSDDVRLQLAISAASQRIAAWCSRPFAKTNFSETYDGTGNPTLVLRNFPVLAIASLTIDGRPIMARASALDSGYGYDGRRTLALFGETFPRAPQCVQVVYTAGFDPVPTDVQLACLEWLKVGYLSADRPADLVMQRAGDHEERYAMANAQIQVGNRVVPMPPSVYAVLSQYKNVVPV